MTFAKLLANSLLVALGTSVAAVILGASAAYAFFALSLYRTAAGMLMFHRAADVARLGHAGPAVRAAQPDHGGGRAAAQEPVRLALAYASGTLPFSIWNLKGYFDTVPKELEEAARIDGATVTQTFISVILPLSVPALVVTVLFSFMSGLDRVHPGVDAAGRPERFTLAMALRSMQGQYSTPWSEFSALSI
jgi:arabinogalactan oligomer/maltooligosaccharide transport system permease protein